MGTKVATPDGEVTRTNGIYISQAARILGVSQSVLRSWEHERLISPTRTPSGYRVFSVQDIERLRHIRDLVQRQGLNPAGVRRLLGNGSGPSGDSEGARSGPHVGDRVQMLRNRRQVSLRELARMTGLSASSISAVERGLSAPSVGTLQRLAVALDTTVAKLLGTPQSRRHLVVRAGERPVLDMETPGVRFENLYTVDTALQSILITVEPGQGSQESYSHEGEEFLYILEGELEITLDELETYNLRQGDAMTFYSTRPHRWWNPGDVTTVTVWVNSPPTF
jgi:DNA-binding transcriptional MerR regulator/quercetin dioxygenase-like cupin family protein